MSSTIGLIAVLWTPVHGWAGLSPNAIDRAVELVDRLYLYPEELEASDLLFSAADRLSDRVDWLLVDSEDGVVYLRHGDGSTLGSVSVASMDTLPSALRMLEQIIQESEYDTGDVDLRLEILSGMTNGLDRYSRLLSGDRLKRFDVRLKGVLVGVGSTLRRKDDVLVVTKVLDGGPAEKGGLQVGDIILRIDDVSTVNMPIREATRRIRGPEGSQVDLRVARGEQRLDLSFQRAQVVVPNVTHEVLPGGVGYIKIDHFSQRTVENLRASMAELTELDALSQGLVLDLRGNTGGSMREAARTADVFIKEGMLLRTAGPDGGQVRNLQGRIDATDAGDEPDIPVVLLVDDRSASASEILAGALVGLDRAAIVGSNTYGKGTVQKIYNLDEGARLKLTVARFLLDQDQTIPQEGLAPDIMLADIVLNENGVQYYGWADAAGSDWENILPVVSERTGWNGQEADPGDLRRNLARQAVLLADGPSRTEILTALQLVSGELREEQQNRLHKALMAKDIDWSPAPDNLEEPMNVTVTVTAEPHEERRDVFRLVAKVKNAGDASLHRLAVVLECPSFSRWDGLVIPIGKLTANGSGQGELLIPLRAGIEPREDEVQLRVHAHRQAPRIMGQAILSAKTSKRPTLQVRAKLVPDAEQHRAEVTAQNRSKVNLTGLEAHFSHPGDVDVELIDRAARLPVVAAGEQGQFDLSVKLGETAPPLVPLELVVETERYGRLASWELNLPASGEEVTWQAPEVRGSHATSAEVGPYELPISATDDRNLDHVVVFANGEKVAWSAGEGSKVSLRARVNLQPGKNLLVVWAEDDQGLRTRQQFVVRGAEPTAVGDVEP